MELKLSTFGQKLCSHSGILELMDDLGQVMAGGRSALMLGGGNPAAIPAVQAVWRSRMQQLLEDGAAFDAMLCNYDPPQGRPAFIRALVTYLRQKFAWDIGPENIAITNGSQTAFFCLFNMLAGEFEDGRRKRVLVPLSPEYIGYADQGHLADLFRSEKPAIEIIGDHEFKYHVDFDHITIDESTAAITVSRPTNPTGNVITNDELQRLSAMAKDRNVPMLIDNAYGAPFPRILFTETTPFWDDHIVLSMSLSKLGLPGARTGIIVAAPEIIRAVSGINAITGLATGNIGPEIVTPLIESGQIDELCDREITPFYAERARQAREWFFDALNPDLPVYLHVCEGALFLWVWCKDLPITSRELYARLGKRGVVVVSGHYFFFGLDEAWPHQHECLRLNYSQSPSDVKRGLAIVAEEIECAYTKA